MPTRRRLLPPGLPPGAPMPLGVLRATGEGIRVLDPGRAWALDRAFHGDGGAAADVDYHLYLSNITPAETDAGIVYTGAEANFTGYLAVEVSDWSASAAFGQIRYTVGGLILFTVGAAPSVTNQAYGYYVTDHATGDVLWAERFPLAPWPMLTPGQQIQITPYFSVKSQAA